MKDFREYIIDRGVVTAEQLGVISVKNRSNEPIYYQLLRKYPELEESIWRVLADFLQISLVNPHEIDLNPQLANLLPAQMAHEFSIVPLSQNGQKVEVAMADPQQFEKCEEFSMLLMRETQNKKRFQDALVVEGRLALPSDVAKMIRGLYGIGAETVQEIIDEQIAPEIMILGPEVVDLTKQEEEGEDAAIVRFVNQLLLEAVKNEASDIHLEPYEKNLQIRYRLDGMLQTEPVPEKIKHLEAAIISRIKIMANLDIAEKRLPQDGQIRLLVMGRPIDVRVSVLPTMFGQGVALRLLDRQVVFRQLHNIGMPQECLSLYRSILTLSHGVILVTGPTGSGKTTTLYASLNEINSEDRKIITVEDPIEYQMQGITQIQVKPQIDLTFANILRNIL
ncbi:MAG: Flp pilus assembly complex ATPase component TadA, partial [Sedimentisphaerales bacterium]|nr:Flp pilus assembly complex ATPase component TadA [Sedimentisphaerales bacterium]